MSTLQIILLIIVLVVVLYASAQFVRTTHFINIGVKLADVAEKVKFEQHPANAELRILMIGDSTVVGVGAAHPRESLAGLVGQTLPDADITNAGLNGRKTKGLRDAMENMTETFDLIMLHTGGNDIVRFTNLKELEADLDALLKAAKDRAPRVMLATSGSLGTALLLPKASRFAFHKRTLAVRDTFMRVAKNNGVPYVDLYRAPKEDSFALDPKEFYCADFFHPSSQGYALWFERIRPVLMQSLQTRSVRMHS